MKDERNVVILKTEKSSAEFHHHCRIGPDACFTKCTIYRLQLLGRQHNYSYVRCFCIIFDIAAAHNGFRSR